VLLRTLPSFVIAGCTGKSSRVERIEGDHIAGVVRVVPGVYPLRVSAADGTNLLTPDEAMRMRSARKDGRGPPPQSVETRSETNPTDSCIQWPPNICCGGLPESKNGNSPPRARRTFSAFTGC
jgi:hypothetical protein